MPYKYLFVKFKKLQFFGLSCDASATCVTHDLAIVHIIELNTLKVN